MNVQELFERWLTTELPAYPDKYSDFIGWLDGQYNIFVNQYLNLEYLDDETAMDVSDNAFNAKELLFLFDYAGRTDRSPSDCGL